MKAVLALLVCLTVFFAQAVRQSCSWTTPDGKASFDLSELRRPVNTGYRTRDSSDTQERNYTYVFNICDDVLPPTPSCENRPSGSGPGPAFQQFLDGNCMRLGRGTEEEKDRKFELIDPEDPVAGVSLTYLNGDSCETLFGEIVNRSFTINFRCKNTFAEEPTERVAEPHLCHYVLDFYTVFGCPLECPFSERKLCGGHGFCAMDLALNRPRCFCEAGYHGPDCNSPAEEEENSCTGLCIGLIFVFLLLLVVGVGTAYIGYRVHKLSKMNIKFTHLTDSFMANEAQGSQTGRRIIEEDDGDAFTIGDPESALGGDVEMRPTLSS